MEVAASNARHLSKATKQNDNTSESLNEASAQRYASKELGFTLYLM